MVERILRARGISDPSFLAPSLNQLHDPSLLPGVDRAAERILLAIRQRERIVVYADYDVDGVSAAAILWHMIRAIDPDAHLSTYLPHRLEEGYGLNEEAIAKLCDANDLIISVDCGVTAVGPARIARDRRIDLIITDHHTPPALESGLPDAFSIVHPAIPGHPPYPFPHLCGAGVAFKLAWRLATLHGQSERASPPFKRLLIELLALAAMGVIADVVPLLGENRVIARFGLERVSRSELVGVRALRDESGIGADSVEAADIGFRLAPRLNAIGRLGHAREALELLTTVDARRASEIAHSLTHWNDERRKTEALISRRAEDLATESGMTSDDHRAIVLCDPSWHRGVVGICCSRLVGRFHRPTILLQRDGELCHGSARSIDGFDLHVALSACSEHLESFGGHAMAAGLKVRADRLERFTSAFVAYANSKLTAADLTRRNHIDSECQPGELNMAAAEDLDRLAPFGRDNTRPLLLIRGARLASTPRMLGTSGKHFSFDIEGSRPALRIKCWNWTSTLAGAGITLKAGSRLDLLISPEINSWNERRSVEASLEDLRLAD